jgi:hypothetical protein
MKTAKYSGTVKIQRSGFFNVSGILQTNIINGTLAALLNSTGENGIIIRQKIKQEQSRKSKIKVREK